jgi:hypothetical protein
MMPATSEGYQPTGLEPNSAVALEDRNPFDCDPQAAEIFLVRLNKALGVARTSSMEDAFLKILAFHGEAAKHRETVTALVDERDNARNALKTAWAYFLKRFDGLKCGPSGTWPQACDEVVEYIHRLQGQVKQLQDTANPPKPEELLSTDRMKLVESIPGLAARVAKIEQAVFPKVATLGDDGKN